MHMAICMDRGVRACALRMCTCNEHRPMQGPHGAAPMQLSWRGALKCCRALSATTKALVTARATRRPNKAQAPAAHR